MKLLLATSSDGFLCKGPNDDMSWTGRIDKALFRLLTISSPSPLFCGKTTAAIMPSLTGREVIGLSRNGMTIYQAQSMHPDAWLIGGPTIAAEALRSNLISTAVICIVPTTLGSGVPIYEVDRLLPQEGARQSIKFGDVDVKVFTRDQKWPAR